MGLIKIYILNTLIGATLFAESNIGKSSIEMGFDNKTFSDNRYRDNRYYLQGVIPLKDKFTLVGLGEKVNRFGQENYNLGGELHKGFENKRAGYLSMSYSPDASFLPVYSVGIHGYQGVGSFELGMGYEFSHYNSDNINMFTPEYSYYFNDKYYLTQKLYLVPQNGSWALSNQIHYDNLSNLKLSADFTYSSSKEQINEINVWSKTNQNILNVNAEYAINSLYTLGAGYTFSKAINSPNSFNANQVNIFVRRYLK